MFAAILFWGVAIFVGMTVIPMVLTLLMMGFAVVVNFVGSLFKAEEK